MRTFLTSTEAIPHRSVHPELGTRVRGARSGFAKLVACAIFAGILPNPVFAGFCTIFGKVVDDVDDRRISEATVAVNTPLLSTSVMSRSTGSFFLDLETNPNYTIIVSHPDYESMTVDSGACESNIFSMIPDVRLKPLDVSAEKYGFLIEEVSPPLIAVETDNIAQIVTIRGMHLDLVKNVGVKMETPGRFFSLEAKIKPYSQTSGSMQIEISAAEDALTGQFYQLSLLSPDPVKFKLLPLSTLRIVVPDHSPLVRLPVEQSQRLDAVDRFPRKILTVTPRITSISPEQLRLSAGGKSRYAIVTGESLHYYDVVLIVNHWVGGSVNHPVEQVHANIVDATPDQLVVAFRASADAEPDSRYQMYLKSSREDLKVVAVQPHFFLDVIPGAVVNSIDPLELRIVRGGVAQTLIVNGTNLDGLTVRTVRQRRPAVDVTAGVRRISSATYAVTLEAPAIHKAVGDDYYLEIISGPSVVRRFRFSVVASLTPTLARPVIPQRRPVE